jgi:hypothetical protein
MVSSTPEDNALRTLVELLKTVPPVLFTSPGNLSNAKPIEATPGQAYFMEKGTPYGFRNTGSSPGMVMEVFVKDAAATAQQEPGGPAGGEDALILSASRPCTASDTAFSMRELRRFCAYAI